jgi:uncharacterized protein YggU (UPF0235/DUF167 family)
MAAALGVPPSGVRLRSGPSARRKVFAVDGLPVDEMRSRLLRAVSGSG